MKKFKLVIVALIVGSIFQVNAQTADEILDTYFENIGGLENLEKIESIKITAVVNQQGMEIPIEIYQIKGGKQASIITFQGKEMKQGVFDGETLWFTNFMTQKAEKSDAEATANMKLESNDFPDSFMNYKEKGYTVELVGKEDFNGTEVFKLKLVKEPVTVDGKQEESVSYYMFDTENFVPLAVQNEIKMGQGKGMVSEITFSDYQEVEGVYMPFSMTQGIKGQGGTPITIKNIEINPEIDPSIFAYPADQDSNEEKKN